MDTASVAAALSVTPTLPLRLGWAGNTLTITPLAPLAPSGEYQFDLGTGAVDRDGTPLAAAYRWGFWLADLLNSTRTPTALRTDPLTLNFNYGMDPDSVRAALALTPAISGTLAWADKYQTVTFAPNQPWPTDTTYTLAFTGTLQDSHGDVLAAPRPITFTTPSPILALDPPEGEMVDPAGALHVTFDRPMDHATTEAAFSLTPPVSGTLDWAGNTLTFHPTGSFFQDNARYQATIAVTARAADGQPILKQPYIWSFNTDQLASEASFGQGAHTQVLDADGQRAVQFVIGPIDPRLLSFDLYELSLDGFLNRAAAGLSDFGESRVTIPTAGLRLAAHWPLPSDPPPAGKYQTIAETTLPAGIGPGLYVLNLTGGPAPDQLLLIVSRQVILVKQSPGQVMAWVTDMQGQAAAGREVAVYTALGGLLAQGLTDQAGIFRANLNHATHPLLVVAHTGDDYTISGLGYEWASPTANGYSWYQPQPSTAQFAAYIYTDRPIYRPGQTVYYKATLRQDDDARLAVPPEQTPVTVRLRDARDNVVQTASLAINPFGTVNGQFQLAEGAMLGDYKVEVTVAGEQHVQTLAVQDYAKPDYTVTVTPDASNYVAGDAIHVSLGAQYLYGQPVPQAAIVIKQYLLYADNCYLATCAGEKYTWSQANEPEIEAVTDSDGRYALTLSAKLEETGTYPDPWGGPARGIWAIEATVDDGSHQAVSSFAIVNVHSAAEKLTLDLGDYFQSPGLPFKLVATATDLNDQPVAGQALQLELREWDSSSSDYSLVAQSQSLGITDAAGRIATTLTVAQSGYYQVHLSGQDGRGNVLSYDTWLYAFSADDQDWANRYTRSDLAIGADKASYAPGDRAQLAITSSFSGTALLTFDRGTSHRQQLVRLTAPLTRVDVVVVADDAPDIFVTVNAWKAGETTLTPDAYLSLADRHLRTAQVELRVPVTDKTLTVTLTPNQSSYAPRTPASFTVKVTDRHGQPVSAEVSLALVDEAIFSLAEDRSGPIFDAFYFERGDAVATFDSMAPYRYLMLDEGGRGGGGDGGALAGAPRSDFPDTAGWVPVVQTDANGQAVVSLPLPDSLTTWRLTARAVTADTQVGEATTRIVTQKPIVVEPVLPRSLTAGDHVEVSAIVHNHTTVALTLSVTIDSDLLHVDQAVTQAVSLAANGQGTVGWTAVALHAGNATVTVRAEGEAGGDAVQLSLPIRPLAVPDVTTQAGAFTGQYATAIDWPAAATDLSTVHIELSRSIAGSLLNGLDYLTGYPYGCVEQTMSRALPNAVVARAFKQLGMTGPTLGADLPAKINASVQRLYGFQHDDGGWGWWLDDNSDAYETAWVVFGLSVTKEAGYAVDPAVVGRGYKWLTANLASMDARTEAFALYSLAVAGQGNLETTQALAAQASQLDTFSQAALALALHRLGAASDSQSMLARLRQTAVARDGYVYWPNAAEDGHYQQKTMASTTRSTALALDAFVKISPNDPLEAGMVRWLMGQRRDQGWGSTNETSFAILALTDHVQALERSTADTPYTVALNGQPLASGTLGPGAPAASLNISASQLVVGNNQLALRQVGGGQLYYLITRRLYLAQSTLPAAGTIAVARAYLAPGTNGVLSQTAPGDLVEVSLTVDLPQDAAYVLVEDNLPGGLEALNEGLNNTSHDALAETCQDEYDCQDTEYHWQELGYNYKEVHSDRVSFFITDMTAGRHTFTFLARVTRRGAFTALPAQVSAMYDARLWGRSASGEIVIGE